MKIPVGTAVVILESGETGVIAWYDGSTAFIDVDVYTGEDYATNDIQAVKDWIELAHEHEKAQFFRVFSPDMIANWSTKS